jgi:hypothetical protein
MIQEYIQNNLPAFDEEPAAGHLERFRAKQKRAHRRRTTARFVLPAVAASVALLLVAGIVAERRTARPAEGLAGGVALCEQAVDMKSCYLGRMNDVAAQIRELSQTFDEGLRQEVLDEVDDLLDTSGDIEREIPGELPDEDANNLLRNYYRQHLESLQSIRDAMDNGQ